MSIMKTFYIDHQKTDSSLYHYLVSLVGDGGRYKLFAKAIFAEPPTVEALIDLEDKIEKEVGYPVLVTGLQWLNAEDHDRLGALYDLLDSKLH